MAYPSDSQFLPILLNGSPLADPPGDESPASTDIVGDARYPAAFYAYDGTTVYFRLRLNADPRFKTGFQNFAWGLLFDTDGVPGTYEWLLAVNGLNTTLELIQNTNKLFNTWNDPAEGTDGRGAPNYSQPIVNFDIARARLTGDGSSFGGNPDYFLDFFLPARVLFNLLGITETTLFRPLFFTSANANNFNKDSLQNQGFSFVSAFGDPTTTEEADVRAELSVSKTVNGPAAALTGQTLNYTGSVTVTNTGKAQATTILVSDAFGLDQVNKVTVSGVSAGLAVFNPLTSVITWNVGNLAPGGSATLSFAAAGQFTAPGARPLNTATAAGTDQFTGQPVPPVSAVFTVSVTATGGVSGTVLSGATGLPAAGASVLLQAPDGSTAGSAVTDAGGGYGFAGLAPGSYSLVVTGAGFTPAVIPVAVAPGQVTAVNPLLNPLPAVVSGTVTDDAGNPIPGAVVRLRSPFAVVLQEVRTDTSGQYAISGIAPDSYSLLAEADGYRNVVRGIQLTAGQTAIVPFVLEPNPGRVSGTVTSGGTPLAGAAVEVLNQAAQQVGVAVTDSAGQYGMASLAPGTYRLRISAEGFATQLIGFTVGPGESRTVHVGLAANPGTVSGVSTDAETGLPLGQVSVRIVNSAGITVASVLTDASGAYAAEALPPGVYTVTFAKDGYAAQSLGAIVVSGSTAVLNSSLAKLAGSVSGTVTDSGGNPLGDATVRIFQNNFIVATVNTAPDGTYSISGLAPGSYVIRTEAEGFTRVLLGAAVLPFETVSVHFMLTPNPGFLSGTVLDPDGLPVPGATIVVRENTAVGPSAGRTLTDLDGRYAFTDLPPGSYIVTADAPGFRIGTAGAIVSRGAGTQVDFQLEPSPGSITGTVVEAGTGAPIGGAGIEIRIISVNGAILQTAFADPAGVYLAEGLPPGSYTVVAAAPNFQTESASVTVTAGVTETVRLALQPNPGGIAGRVTDAETGEGLPGATVKVTDSSSALVGLALTDSQGVFEVDGLRPGSYTVSAIHDGYQHDLIGAVVDAGNTTPVALGLFPNPGSIVGTLQPSPNGTLVQLYDMGNLFVASRIADPEGRFRFDNIAAGTYLVTAAAQDFITVQAGVTVRSGQESALALSLLPAPASVSGTVTDPGGNPVTNAVIRFLDVDEVLVGIGSTDANGFYETGNLPGGSLILTVTAPGFAGAMGGVTAQPGQTVTGASFVLEPAPGSITGQVTDVSNGLPVPGAAILIRSSDSQGVLITSLATTLFGNYSAENLQPGSYTVTASAPGYATRSLGAVVAGGQAASASFVLPILTGAIAGTVRVVGNRLVEGEGVTIRLLDSKGIMLESLLANQDGTFAFTNLPPGAYQVHASSPGFVAATVAVRVSAQETAAADLILEAEPGQLAGTVTDAVTGIPVSGAILTVSDPAGSFIGQGVSGGTGAFSLDRLPSGQLSVSVTAPGYGAVGSGVVILPGQPTAVSFVLTPEPGQVSGFVVSLLDGLPVEGARIEILDGRDIRLLTLLTDSTGFYLAGNLAPGSYTARVSAGGYNSDLIGFVIGPGGTANGSFALFPEPGTVRGTVTNALNGQPVQGTRVDLCLSNTYGEILETALTEPDGRYEVTGLLPQNYTVVVTREEFASQTDSALLGAGSEVVLNFAIEPRAVTVGGTVRDAGTDDPLGNVLIRLINDRGVVTSEAQSAPDGRYLLEGNATGDYTLVFQRPDRRLETVFVSLSMPGPVTVNASMRPLPAVQTGTVTQLLPGVPNPLAGAIVQVLDRNLSLVAASVTDGTGQFRLEGLAPGFYTIVVSAPGFGSAASAVQITAGGAAAPIVFALDPNPGHLAGSVRDERGKPLYLVSIQVAFPNEVAVRSVISNRSGRYGVTDLAPGVYRISFALEGKQTLVRNAVIRAGQTTILDVVLLDDEDE